MSLNIDKSNWIRVKLGDVVRNVNETVKDPQSLGIDRTIGLEHIESGNFEVQGYGTLEEGVSFTRRVRPGQVLFGKRRAYLRKVAVASFDAVCSSDILVFEPKAKRLDERFLPFLVSSDNFFDTALQTSAGSMSPRTSWKALAAYEFLLPPIEEQYRIADLLWQFEQTLESLSEAEQIVSSSRETAFESLIRELDVPLVDLRQLLSYSTVGVVVKPTSLYTDSPDGVPALRGRDIRPGVVDTSQCVRFDREKEKTVSKSRLQLDDVVVVRSGRPGDAARISEENVGMNCIDLLLLRPSSALLGEFLELCLNSTFCRKQTAILSGGSAQQHLNLGNIRSFKIPNVSLSQQNSMVESVTRFKSLQAIIHQEILDTQGLKNSLMLQLLGGSDVH